MLLDSSNFVINMDLFLNEGLSMCQQKKENVGMCLIITKLEYTYLDLTQRNWVNKIEILYYTIWIWWKCKSIIVLEFVIIFGNQIHSHSNKDANEFQKE